ncbi:MAG: WYL domain-containing protein [Planctomycetota bacterium]
MSEQVRDKMARLVELADKRRLVEIHYRKHLTSGEAVPRVVEPYNFTRGQQDVILRCYQLEPDRGWRFFMVHKVERVEDGGEAFEPRVRVTLSRADIASQQQAQTSGSWSDRVRRYRDLVSDAMADGTLTVDETEAIRRYAAESGLTDDERNYVHAAIFHRCLGTIVEDGEVQLQEREQIQFLHRVLDKLGWGVVDV